MDCPKEDEASLGEIHKKYNYLVRDVITNKKTTGEKTFIAEKLDMDNLLKIDVACHNKDIDYVLSVLKSEDMLYVSRALKKSIWLVNDEYEHIINPKYLNNELLPEMTTRAGIKLMKHIREHLRTERRVEEFYNNENSANGKGRWLQHCSIPFIEKNIGDYVHTISELEFKHLCERSVTIFQESMKKSGSYSMMKTASFLLNTHMDIYLDVFEETHKYNRSNLSPKATELIMKKCPDRIKNNFFTYIYQIHVPTFVKFLNKQEIETFLYKLANKDEKDCEGHFRKIFQFRILKMFIRRMPKEEQFHFVQKVFLDNKFKDIKEPLQRGSEMFAVKCICDIASIGTPSYHWYEFAPFDIAFADIKKLIHDEKSMCDKYSMLKVLLNCADSNVTHLLSLLTYYSKNHKNDGIGDKQGFVKKILLQSEIYKLDLKTWDTVMNVLSNMEIYTKNELDQSYSEIIILYHVLHNKPVEEEIEKKMSFDTLKTYRPKLNQNEQNKLFEYLFSYVNKEIQNSKYETEEQFCDIVKLHNKLLNLLNYWHKQITDYPDILTKIKNLVQIRNKNNWKTDLSSLYTINKSWKKYMFEESLELNPSPEVCVNALKHGPALLKRYNNEVEKLCCNDTISLSQMLKKIKIYWPKSLADTFSKSYLDRLNTLRNHKALTQGLFTVLTKDHASEIINKYAPVQAKIDWSNINELTLSLQRSIAKNMHIARPQPSADAIILYAKGDYLQYALPSLLAIYYNMSRAKSQHHIPKLLDAPVSLQKHGLRLAFQKLKHEELKFHLANVWKTTKNITIRAVTFVLLFDLLCKEKDDSKAVELWEILKVFMDNLSFEEDKKIYDKLSDVQNVPLIVRAKFLVKSYNFLQKLLPHSKTDRDQYEYNMERLATYTREVMESISPDFVSGLITEYLDKKFFNREVTYVDRGMVKVISSYLLCAKTEEIQTKKYEEILVPIIKRSLDLWNEIHEGAYFMRDHFQVMLTILAEDLRYCVIENKMIIPTKMFQAIKNELDYHLTIPENYIMLTMWKLIVKLTELIAVNEKRENWDEVCEQIVQGYGKYCLDVLKEDVKLYFSCIYILYSKILTKCVEEILTEMSYLKLIELILGDTDFIQGYLVIIKLFDNKHYWYGSDEVQKKVRDLRKTLCNHPSVEVKMHYYCAFKNDNENEE